MVEEARIKSQDKLESEKIDSTDDEEAQVHASTQAHAQNHVVTTTTPEINQPSQELGLASNATAQQSAPEQMIIRQIGA